MCIIIQKAIWSQRHFYNIIWKRLYSGRLHSLITFQRAVNYTFCMCHTLSASAGAYVLYSPTVSSLLHKNSMTALLKWYTCSCRHHCLLLRKRRCPPCGYLSPQPLFHSQGEPRTCLEPPAEFASVLCCAIGSRRVTTNARRSGKSVVKGD